MMEQNDLLIFVIAAIRTLLISLIVMFLVAMLLLKYIEVEDNNTNKQTYFANENINIERVHRGQGRQT